MSLISQIAAPGQSLSANQVAALIAQACPGDHYRGKRVLLIVPDGTRTAPLGPLFRALHAEIGPVAVAMDVMVALGTHQPMTEPAICQRLEISAAERHDLFARVRFLNHAWDDPAALTTVGIIAADEIHALTGGRFSMDVAIEVNRALFAYDQLILIGPVFPHEVIGFSGGNKYLFPGVAGPRILHFFHWLGAVITTPKVIGHLWTPVRRVVDRAAAMVAVPKLCCCMVVEPSGLRGLFVGAPEAAWAEAAQLSHQCHVVLKPRPFRTVLACAPLMYDDLWTAGKCMYKLEQVVADGGELIIYAPHVKEFSVTHGQTLRAVGYHCRDYFLRQWERFQHYPWGVLAHATHVFGLGTYQDGVETPRVHVTLATAISEARCRQANLGFRAPGSIVLAQFAGREAEGILLEPKAGERLYRLENPPPWAA